MTSNLQYCLEDVVSTAFNPRTEKGKMRMGWLDFQLPSVKKYRLDLVKELAVLAMTFDDNELDSVPLHAAAKSGLVDELVVMLDLRAKDINCLDVDSRTPLMAAAHERRLETVKVLLEYGAEVNYCSVEGETALMLACNSKVTDWGEEAIQVIRILRKPAVFPRLSLSERSSTDLKVS